MPSIIIHPPARHSTPAACSPINPLPELLQTPSGYAILELQGTFNLPQTELPETHSSGTNSVKDTAIGRIVFPLYDPANKDDMKWMKQVYLYVGKHQRMTGEVKKLTKPLAVLRRRQEDEGEGDLEVVEIVRYKVLFASRPEPVSAEAV